MDILFRLDRPLEAHDAESQPCLLNFRWASPKALAHAEELQSEMRQSAKNLPGTVLGMPILLGQISNSNHHLGAGTQHFWGYLQVLYDYLPDSKIMRAGLGFFNRRYLI